MKKYLLSLFAVVLAVAAMSFKATPKQNLDQVYYWYYPNGELMDETPSETPPNDCVIGDTPLCGYGHINPIPAQGDPSVGFDLRAKTQ